LPGAGGLSSEPGRGGGLAGSLLIGLAYRWGKRVGQGHNLVLDERRAPSTTIPLRLVPLVLGGTLLTHLLGRAAGGAVRPGAAGAL